jgi:ferredoxin-2, mitochondrial
MVRQTSTVIKSFNYGITKITRCFISPPLMSLWAKQMQLISAKSSIRSTATSQFSSTDNTVQSSTPEGTITNTPSIQTVPITFVESDGKERLVQAEIGKHLLDVAHDNHVDLEGACGGELSCSTCHLIFESHIYDKLPPKLDDEQDMLDLAFGVTET